MKAKSLLRVALATALVLLVPLVAMQFSDEVNWTLIDFATAGVLLFGAGLALDFTERNLRQNKSRALIGIAVLAVLALVWIELAVGLFGTPFAGS